MSFILICPLIPIQVPTCRGCQPRFLSPCTGQPSAGAVPFFSLLVCRAWRGSGQGGAGLMPSATGRNSNVTLFAFPSTDKHLLHVLSRLHLCVKANLTPPFSRSLAGPLAQSNPSEVPDWDNLLSFMDFATYVGPLGTFWQVMIEFTACFFPFLCQICQIFVRFGLVAMGCVFFGFFLSLFLPPVCC